MSDTLTIRVTDSTGKFTQGVFLVPVVSANPPIITTSSPLNEATVGVAYTQAAPLETMAASSGTPPYTWALLSQTGVNAWTVGTGGKIKGTPTAAETDTLTIQVTDNNLMTAQGTFSLPVAAVLSISTTSPLPNATQGTAYSDAMAAVGGVSPYSWSLLSQTGTNAWSMTGANVVGTPGNVETDQLTIQVTDSIFDTVQGVFSLNVNSASSGAITFSPNSGAPPQTVTITSNPAGTIYYTSDGSTPYFWPSELYYAPVLVTVAPTTLQALSYQGTQTKQQYSTTGITPGVNFWVAGGAGTGRGNPPNGTFALFSDQAGTNGAFAVNTWNAGQYTGFQPNNKATAQLAYLGTGNANTTTAQYEGNTIGAYLVASEGYANGNSDQMIAAQTFFNGLTIFNNSNAVLHESMLLQIPTSSGTKPWAPIKHYFDGSANGRPSFDVFILLWRASGGTGIATNIDTHGNNISGPNGAITLSVPLVPANSTYVTIAPGSTTYTSGAGSTWNGFLPFSYSMSYAQIVAALTYINANIPGGWTGGTNFGTDPSQYVITNIHGNFEIQNLTASDTDVLGWSMQNFCSSLLTAPSTVGSATYSSGVGGAPSAPTNVIAYVDQACVYVRFTPGAAGSGGPTTSYTATASSGETGTSSATLIALGSNSYNTQLNLRCDIPGMNAQIGSTVTVTVHATNASGNSVESAAATSPVIPALASPYLICAGNQNNGTPPWGDFSNGTGSVVYGVTPGTLSSAATGSHAAPTNPVLSSDNVLAIQGNEEFLPFVNSINPTSTLGGRFKLAPYTYMVIRIYPLQAQSMQVQWEKTVWIDGVATVGSTGTLLTDTNQNWPTNFFAGGNVVQNIRTGAFGYSVVSNTANTITMNNAVTFLAGDYYQIACSDQYVGGQFSFGGGQTLPSGSTGPATWTVGAWNTYKIPLTAFNGGPNSYTQLVGADILKVGLQATNMTNANLNYLCEFGVI